MKKKTEENRTKGNISKQPDRENLLIYKVGLCILPLFIASVVAFLVWGDQILANGSPCKFRSITGLCCPGCGGTRSFYHLVRLHLLQSFRYHCVVPTAVIAYVVFMVDVFLRRHTKWAKWPRVDFFVLCYFIAGLLAAQWVAKIVLMIFLKYELC